MAGPNGSRAGAERRAVPAPAPRSVAPALVLVAALGVHGCNGQSGSHHPSLPATPPGAAEASMAVVPALFPSSLRQQLLGHRALRDKALARPHAFFRLLAAPFAQQVCQRLASGPSWTVVNLHGDAHLEQVAVRGQSHGLVDYDHAAVGPAAIDLVRFGASVVLVCREHRWHAAPLVRELLDRYAVALRSPPGERPVPTCLARLRAALPATRQQFLSLAEAQMRPLPPDWEGPFRERFAAYGRQLLASHPDLPAEFFTIRRVGTIGTGLGSALDRKMLVRVQGPGPGPDDDLIIEAKQLRTADGAPCIHVEPGKPTVDRVLRAHAIFSDPPPRYLAPLPPLEHGGAPSCGTLDFWVHEWTHRYVELDSGSSLRSVGELREVVRDVAMQLGQAHPRRPEPAEERIAREKLARELEGQRQMLTETIHALADAAYRGWRQARAEWQASERH